MKWFVIEIESGERVSKAYHNRNGASNYCDECNHFAGGIFYKVVMHKPLRF